MNHYKVLRKERERLQGSVHWFQVTVIKYHVVAVEKMQLLEKLTVHYTRGVFISLENCDKEEEMETAPTFNDGLRLIDMVLVYKNDENSRKPLIYRQKYEENLIKHGLQLEDEIAEENGLVFTKVHTPDAVLERYSESSGIKKPALLFGKSEMRELLDECRRRGSLQLRGRNRASYFSGQQRTFITWQLMTTAYFSDNDRGIQKLLSNGTYVAAYPLHDGLYKSKTVKQDNCKREMLYREWASPKNWYRKQPLHEVRNYFGEKVGLYFAWLGFYTKMLIPASVFGFICFLYGLIALLCNSEDSFPSQEICDEKGAGNKTMCSACNNACTYTRLYESCLYSRVSYVFDSPAAVAFSIFMAFWACIFLELWKRRQAELAWLWDLSENEEDFNLRPEFEGSVKTKKFNVVTGREEPHLTFWNKSVRLFTSASAVAFMVAVAVTATLGVIVYRLSVVTAIYAAGGYIKKYSKLITSATASLINLVVIMLLTQVYTSLSRILTNLENPRTAGEYEKSITFKIFVFQSINFYASLIYIAFFKGRFYTYPGDEEIWESPIKSMSADICGPAGCMSDLLIQLAIIMVGKQVYGNVIEILTPALKNWWRKRSARKSAVQLTSPWVRDYTLVPFDSLTLFREYLEMVIQYGFVTLFVAAFPLAPLFALLNNIAEIRIDAMKLTTQLRRPLPKRVKDIEPWYGILSAITSVAVAVNGFVIAYTSDFIPRLVYKYAYSPDGSLKGYIDFSLSAFNTSDYGPGMGPDTSPGDYYPEVCYYQGFRNPPGHPHQYEYSPVYWHVFAARMSFVVAFEHIVFILTGLLAYIIPDTSRTVRQLQQRERLVIMERLASISRQGREENNTQS
ncbi:anoctamin-5-like isoform X1 [Schistocerca gregaria]|uniref:anoctamin-5-like isoform X1 n=2 Tax=Schistocerca gregaria TaxID=7010 RepID=UPI00211E9E0C|nr:anoctamin-5-like isoform X1 [Schistocerca gregaria]